MFETIVIIAVVLAVIIAAILILAATKPDTFRIERTAVMNAPAEKIFPLIADFHQWLNWSPWEGRDPALKRTYSGAEQECWLRAHGNSRGHDAFEGRDQARLPQTVRGS
jgi:hypothetical protein